MDSRRHSMEITSSKMIKTKRRSSILKQTKIDGLGSSPTTTTTTRRLSLQEVDFNVAIDDFTQIQNPAVNCHSPAGGNEIKEFCLDPRIGIDKENNKDVPIVIDKKNKEPNDKQSKDATSAMEKSCEVRKDQESESSARSRPDLGLLLTGPIQYLPLSIDTSKDSSYNDNVGSSKTKPVESFKKHGRRRSGGGCKRKALETLSDHSIVGERTCYDFEMSIDQTNRSFYVEPSPSEDECSDMQMDITEQPQEHSWLQKGNKTIYFDGFGETMNLTETVMNQSGMGKVTSPLTPPPTNRTLKDVLKTIFSKKENILMSTKDEEKMEDEDPVGQCSNKEGKKEESISNDPQKPEEEETIEGHDEENLVLNDETIDITNLTHNFSPRILTVCSTSKPKEQSFNAQCEPQLNASHIKSYSKIDNELKIVEMENKIETEKDIIDTEKSSIVGKVEEVNIDEIVLVEGDNLAKRHEEAENRSMVKSTEPQTEEATIVTSNRSSISKKGSLHNTIQTHDEKNRSSDASHREIQKEPIAEVCIKDRQAEEEIIRKGNEASSSKKRSLHVTSEGRFEKKNSPAVSNKEDQQRKPITTEYEIDTKEPQIEEAIIATSKQLIPKKQSTYDVIDEHVQKMRSPDVPYKEEQMKPMAEDVIRKKERQSERAIIGTSNQSIQKKRPLCNTIEERFQKKRASDASFKEQQQRKPITEDEVRTKERPAERPTLHPSSSRSHFLSFRLLSSTSHLEKMTPSKSTNITDVASMMKTLGSELPELNDDSVFEDEMVVTVDDVRDNLTIANPSDEIVRDDLILSSLKQQVHVTDLKHESLSRSRVKVPQITTAAESHISALSVDDNISKNYENIDDVEFPNATMETIRSSMITTFASCDHSIAEEILKQTEIERDQEISVKKRSSEVQDEIKESIDLELIVDTNNVVTNQIINVKTKDTTETTTITAVLSCDRPTTEKVSKQSETEKDEILASELKDTIKESIDLVPILDTNIMVTSPITNRKTETRISFKPLVQKKVEVVSEVDDDEIVSQEMPQLLEMAEDLVYDFESACCCLNRLVGDLPTEEECLELERLNAEIEQKQQTLNKLDDVLRAEKKERREMQEKEETLKTEVEKATKAKEAEEKQWTSLMWLTRCCEFFISEWSDTTLHLSFLNDTLHLSFSLAPPLVSGGKVQTIVGVSKWSELKDGSDPLKRYCYDSLWRSIDREDLLRRCRTTDDLKYVFHEISVTSTNVRMLYSNLQSITVSHNVFVKDENISIEFIDLNLMIDFVLKFAIIPGTYPDEPISFSIASLYGKPPEDTLIEATKVNTGPCYLTRVVNNLEETLKKLPNENS